MAAPRVSVLLPVFQAAATLGLCLRSLTRQTLADWECVLVDDGSSDGSGEIASDFARRDPRVRLISRPHLGLVPALMAGLERCRGRFVARMDADDWMHRRRLAEQVGLLEQHPDWAGVGCHVRMVPRSRLGEGLREYESWLNSMRTPDHVRAESFVECPVAHPTLMVRRETLLHAGYRDQGWPEDYDLVLRLLEAGERLGMLPHRRLNWRDGPLRLSRTDDRFSQQAFVRCKAAFLSAGFLSRGTHYVLWGHGGTGRAMRRALAQHGKHPAFIIEVHPGRLGNSIAGAPVVPVERIPELPRLPLLASVAGAKARSEIRTTLSAYGLTESRDFYCVA